MGFSERLFIFLFLLSTLTAPGRALAGESGSGSGFFSRETKRLGVNYTMFSGDKNTSLTGGSGFGLEAGITRGNSFLQILTKVRLDYAAGKGDFLDTATALSLDYKLIGVNAGLGIRFNPVASSKPESLGIYFGGVGTFGMAQLTLPDRTYTELVRSQISTAVGYDIFAGVEFGAWKSGSRIYIEAALRSARAKLGGGASFQLDGLVLQGGLAW